MVSSSAIAIEPSPQKNARRAALVAVVWLISAAPFLLGVASCPTAKLFHVACPGCGMTRALRFLADGEIGRSLAMHPVALPTALVQIVFAAVTVWATLAYGAPWALWRARGGRAAVYAVGAVLACDVIVWIVRLAGGLGGPVPV